MRISGAFGPSQSDSPPSATRYPSTSPSFNCPKHIPSSHFIPLLHPSDVLKFISPYLSSLVSPLHSLPPSGLSLSCSPCSVTVSSHSINQACEARAQCSTVLVWSHQCQSVSLTLSVTLKRFWLPDIVCFHPAPSQRRRWEGIELDSRFSLAL